MNDLSLWLTLHKVSARTVDRSCKACVPARTEEPLSQYGQQRARVECPYHGGVRIVEVAIESILVSLGSSKPSIV